LRRDRVGSEGVVSNGDLLAVRGVLETVEKPRPGRAWLTGVALEGVVVVRYTADEGASRSRFRLVGVLTMEVNDVRSGVVPNPRGVVTPLPSFGNLVVSSS